MENSASNLIVSGVDWLSEAVKLSYQMPRSGFVGKVGLLKVLQVE